MSQAGIRSDPQASISGAKQGQDAGGRQFFSGLGSPSNKTLTIELEEPSLCSRPEVAVCGLGDIEYSPPEIPVLNNSDTVTIL